MSTRSVSRKYAVALGRLAREAGTATRVRQDLESVVELLRSTPELGAFLESPDIAQREKAKFLERILKGKVESVVVPFLLLVLRRGRTGLLPEILSEYVRIDEEDRGIQRASLVSAVPLRESDRERVLSQLKRITGREIVLESTVDPAIIGGIIVYVDGDVIDGSVRSRLEELRARLLEVPVH